MSGQKQTDNSYIVQLDGLRFFAIFSVMFGHWTQWQINRPLVNGFPFGNGVTLFFVLSGFLITDILLKNRDKGLQLNVPKDNLIKAFYMRRVLRIFPLYFGTIIFLYLISYKNTREIFPWLATFSSNIYQAINSVYVGDFNHFWSLAVEEQFYLFWPWLIILLPSKHTEKIIITLIAVSVITKFYIFAKYPDRWMANSYFTLSCMHALGIGALVAYWSIYRKNIIAYFSDFKWVYTSMIVYFSLHYIAYFNKLDWYIETLDNVLFAGMSAIIINLAAQNKFESTAKKILENKFIVYSGKISYGLYVFHLFVPAFFWEFLSNKAGMQITNKYTAFIVFYFITFAMAHISWKLMEKPLNDLKSKFPYLKRPEVTQEVAG
ncbi:MAG: acyltransferase family protein [Bacteroidia bacterium]